MGSTHGGAAPRQPQGSATRKAPHPLAPCLPLPLPPSLPSLSPLPLAAYEVPDGAEVEVFRGAIEALPDQDNPELFGLHSNADLTFRRLQVGARAGLVGQPLRGRKKGT